YGSGLDIDQKRFLKRKTFFGNEIVPTTRRLCLMNMYLHNIGELDGEPSVSLDDSLIADTGARFDYVITNPPFGKKTAQTVTNDDGEEEKERAIYNRQDFWTTTSNTQLNFVQHIHTILKTTGHAAVVLPDNVLFEGGAGETIRRKLMETMELHTILRLPTGIFYAQGVKANVLFFDARPAAKTAQTREVWVYDYRTNIHHTLKQNPLKVSDLKDFIDCYNPQDRHKRKEIWSESNPEGRWRKFTYEEILARPKTNLDFKWLKDDAITPDDYTLAEVMGELAETGKTYATALKELQSLVEGIAE
ncbi:MAG: N-6 DNA methylase, partial [Kiritimatiellae bacterium]|nr:N-6 DNA methylase [Kiritimatiellia bacterium]